MLIKPDQKKVKKSIDGLYTPENEMIFAKACNQKLYTELIIANLFVAVHELKG